MRRYQTASYRLVNEQYDYYAEVVKPIDKIMYNQVWIWYFEDISDIGIAEDMQYRIMESIAKRGYIKYGRKAVDRKAEGENK